VGYVDPACLFRKKTEFVNTVDVPVNVVVDTVRVVVVRRDVVAVVVCALMSAALV